MNLTVSLIVWQSIMYSLSIDMVNSILGENYLHTTTCSVVDPSSPYIYIEVFCSRSLTTNCINYSQNENNIF